MQQNQSVTPRKLYRTFAFVESGTGALLVVGLIAKAVFNLSAVVTIVVGGLHGTAFLAYAVVLALVGVNQRWSFGKILGGMGLAVVPLLTIPFEIWVNRKGALLGDWRKSRTDHPRDANWFDSLFRWFIARPVLLSVVMVAVIAIIFAALLLIGPPGGWQQNR